MLIFINSSYCLNKYTYINNTHFQVIWKLKVEVAVSAVMIYDNNARTKMSIEELNKAYDLGVITLIYKANLMRITERSKGIVIDE